MGDDVKSSWPLMVGASHERFIPHGQDQREPKREVETTNTSTNCIVCRLQAATRLAGEVVQKIALK